MVQASVQGLCGYRGRLDGVGYGCLAGFVTGGLNGCGCFFQGFNRERARGIGLVNAPDLANMAFFHHDAAIRASSSLLLVGELWQWVGLLCLLLGLDAVD